MVLSDAYLARLQKIADYAVTKIGCGYIYGATGWVCSPARREQQAAQYPKYADKILGVGAKWDGKQCFDCATFTRFAVQSVDGKLPSGATSQWKGDYWLDKGLLATMPDVPGVLLYRWDGTSMQHTGIYIGGGEHVNAYGHDKGVIKQKMSQYPWTHWALPRLGQDDGGGTVTTQQTAVVHAGSGKTVNMRKVPYGDIVLKYVPIGTRVTVLERGEDNCKISYDGATGYMLTLFLRFDEGEAPSDTTPPTDADRLLQIRNMAAEIVRLADLEMGVV